MAFRTVFCYSLQPTFGQLQLSEWLTKHSGTNNFLLDSKQWTHATKAEIKEKSSPEKNQLLCNVLVSLRAFLHFEPKNILLKILSSLGPCDVPRFHFSLDVDFPQDLVFSSRLFFLMVKILFIFLTILLLNKQH